MIDHERATQMPLLTEKFFQRPVEDVAPDLIGSYLFTNFGGERCGGMIIEAEAYDENDPFAHCYSGRKNKSNAAMFFAPAHIYLYYSGQLPCLNLVTHKEGFGSAVLIRALFPTCNSNLMHKRRTTSYRAKYLDKNQNPKNWQTKLCHGPGALCEALGISDADYKRSMEGLTVFEPQFEMRGPVEKPELISGVRIGLDKQFDGWKKAGDDRAAMPVVNEWGAKKLRWGADGYQRFMAVPSFVQQWINR